MAVRARDGSFVDDYFELPLPSDDSAEVTIEYSPELATCNLDLAIAIQVGDEISAYTSIEQEPVSKLPETPYLVQDINPLPGGAGSFHVTEVTALGAGVVFAANDLVLGLELWRSDGTPDGTVLLKDIRPGSVDSFPQELTRIGDFVYFTADDGTRGRELWPTARRQAPYWWPTLQREVSDRRRAS